MKKLFLLLIPAALGAQKLNVTTGIHMLGGLNYKMEHEVFGAGIGLNYLPKKATALHMGASFNYFNDFFPEKKGNENDFYVIKMQAAKPFAEWFTATTYLGYANTWENDIMKAFAGTYRTNLSWGVGVQAFDDTMTGELLFESVAGYPHISAGVRFNIVNLLKPQK